MIFEVEPGRIWGIDSGLGHPLCTAVYLVRTADGDVLVDCSAGLCFETVMAGLVEVGANLVGICPTHVHLDHAGGCGHLVQAFPDAKVVAHPRAARHLADPSKLIAGAREVWGEERFAQMYGDTIPVWEDQIVVANHGDVHWGLQFFDAPGHARHHYMVWDEASRTVFAGDSFGLSYEGGISYPSSSPVQFDPGAARDTVRHILSLNPKQVAITHFGAFADVAERGAQMLHMLDEFENLALRLQKETDRKQKIMTALRELHPPNENRLRYETDIEINSSGLDFWLSEREKAEVAS